MAFQYINNLHEDTVNERIPNTLYNEENLNTLQEIFALAVKETYGIAIKDKVKFLQAHWYGKVRQMEVAEPEERNGTEKSTQLPSTKRPRSTYMEVKEEAHFACPCCGKAFKRKNACSSHMKKVHPYSGDLQMEPQYTIPQSVAMNAAALSTSETEVEVAESIDLENELESTPGDQLFVLHLPVNEGALSQQSIAQSVPDQELSAAPVQPGIEDDQGSNQDDFQLPAIWFDE